MLVNVRLGSLYHPALGSKVGTGQRNLVVEVGRKWVKMTSPYTLASEWVKRAVWDEDVAPTVMPTTLNPRKLKAQLLKDVEGRVTSYRLSLESGLKEYPPADIDKYVATRRKSLMAVVTRVVEAAKAAPA